MRSRWFLAASALLAALLACNAPTAPATDTPGSTAPPARAAWTPAGRPAAFARFEKEALRESAGPDNANRELVFYYVDHARRPAEALRLPWRSCFVPQRSVCRSATPGRTGKNGSSGACVVPRPRSGARGAPRLKKRNEIACGVSRPRGVAERHTLRCGDQHYPRAASQVVPENESGRLSAAAVPRLISGRRGPPTSPARPTTRNAGPTRPPELFGPLRVLGG